MWDLARGLVDPQIGSGPSPEPAQVPLCEFMLSSAQLGTALALGSPEQAPGVPSAGLS